MVMAEIINSEGLSLNTFSQIIIRKKFNYKASNSAVFSNLKCLILVGYVSKILVLMTLFQN